MICESRADGSGKEEIIYEPADQGWLRYVPTSWSPDGRYLFTTGNSDKTEFKDEIFIFDRKTGKQEPFFTSPSTFDRDAVVSPNGRWVAYSSGDLGVMKVYVEHLKQMVGNGRYLPISVSFRDGPKTEANYSFGSQALLGNGGW